MIDLSLETTDNFIGKEIGVSDWLRLDQERVTTFAHTTLDPDWMHVDVERAKAESPWGGTIVQGFLMLSLVIHFNYELGLKPRGMAYALNYGLDRVRFISPVLVGARVRDRIVLTDFHERADGQYLCKSTHTLEVEGGERPAMVADWLTLWFRDLNR